MRTMTEIACKITGYEIREPESRILRDNNLLI